MRVAGSRATQRGPIARFFFANGRVRSAARWSAVVGDHRRRRSRWGCCRAVGASSGAFATSRDTHRYVRYRGVRYGCVLNSQTRWPIADALRWVTVHAAACTEAGLLAKLPLLRGVGAKEFLKLEKVRA